MKRSRVTGRSRKKLIRGGFEVLTEKIEVAELCMVIGYLLSFR